VGSARRARSEAMNRRTEDGGSNRGGALAVPNRAEGLCYRLPAGSVISAFSFKTRRMLSIFQDFFDCAAPRFPGVSFSQESSRAKSLKTVSAS